MSTITASHLITSATADSAKTSPYRYLHLLPHFSPTTYPPLTPFEHTDPGLRALAHHSPRSLLDGAIGTIELTPNLGTEVYGINLAQLDFDSRDQLALEVPLIVFHIPSSRLRHAMDRLPSEGFWFSGISRNLLIGDQTFTWNGEGTLDGVWYFPLNRISFCSWFEKASYSSHVGPPRRLS